MEKKLTRAEELALKAYPISTSYLSESNGDGDRNHPRRLAFIEGYEQAEKDLNKKPSEDLEEAAKEYASKTLCDPDDGPSTGLAKESFIAGVKWQRKQECDTSKVIPR